MRVTQSFVKVLCTASLLMYGATAQGQPPPPGQTKAASTTATRVSTSATGSSGITTAPSGTPSTSSDPADVYLTVPTLSVGRIELDVDNLEAQLNLQAKVASLVSLNAGVAVGITKVNLTIADVDANLELTVRLGHLVDIVSRVFESLDANPSLVSGLIGNVTQGLGDIVGAVDGLLGSITQGGKTLNFLIDNLGNIVQEVGGVSSIVGSYTQNMTATGVTQNLGNGLIQKQFSYSPLQSLVNIVFNAAGQVVQATVQKATGGSGSGSNSTVAR